MCSAVARWPVNGGQVQLHRGERGLWATFLKGRETTRLEFRGIPLQAPKLLEEIYYPTLYRDLQGRATRIDFHVKGLGGCYWKWLCCCNCSDERELQRPLLQSSRILLGEETVSKNLPQTVEELVAALRSPNLSENRRRVLLQLAEGMVDRFPRVAPSFAIIRELAALAEIPHPQIISRVLEKLTRLVRDQVTLSFPLIQGLATALERVPFQCLNSDDLVQILNVLVDRLCKTHLGDEQKIAQELQAIVRVFNAMADLDVRGLSRVKIHDPVYQTLDQFSKSQGIVAVWATCAKQALIRIRSDETMGRLFLRKCQNLSLGVFNLVGLVRTHQASHLIEAFDQFRKLCQRQDPREEWYDQLRVCEWLLFMGEIELLKRDFSQSKHPFFAWSLVCLCDQIIQTSPSNSTREEVFGFLVEIFQNGQTPPELKEKLASLFLAYSQTPELALQTGQLIDLSSISLHPLLWLEKNPIASRSLLQIAKKFTTPIETKLESIRKSLLGDEIFREIAAFYVPALGAQDLNAAQTFDLQEMVMKFLPSSQKVLLILGNAGSGKSLFSETTAASLWDQYEPDAIIPLFISLALLKDPIHNAIPEFLSSFGFSPEEIEEMRQTRSFVFILDGFDEINQLQNLYVTNQLHRWKCHVIITCRTQYLISIPDYSSYFAPTSHGKRQTEHFLETTIAPFSPAQRGAFLQKYVPEAETDWKEWEQYEKEIQRIPGLAQLTQTPFLLKVAVDVLPDIIVKHLAEHPEEVLRITQADLYDAFVWHWFERQKNKIIESGQNVESRTLIEDFDQFCKALAKKMTEKNLTVVTYVEKSTLFSSSKADEWEPFFGNNNPRRVLARTGAPLRKFGPYQWGFLHDSLRAYFYSKQIGD